MVVGLVVNGEEVEVDVAPTTRLVDVLRGRLGLTGAKDACGRGDCGACTVLVGDRAVLACLTLAARVAEPVRTVEGIAAEAAVLRRALADRGGLQCGYCTPGLVVRGWEMLETAGAGQGDGAAATADAAAEGEAARAAADTEGEAVGVGPGPKEEAAADAIGEAEVRAGLSGNFCRCTGYNGAVAALLDARRG